MENKLRKAKIKSSGVQVEVYRVANGWCNYADCTTVYQENELEFLN